MGIQVASPAALHYAVWVRRATTMLGIQRASRKVSGAFSKNPGSAHTVRSFQRAGIRANDSVRNAAVSRALPVLPQRGYARRTSGASARKAMRLTSPPKGVMGLALEASRTCRPGNTGLEVFCIAR
jgi:hypothetical protein